MPTSVLLDRFSLFAGRLGLGVALAASIAGTPGCGKPKHATA